MIPLLGCMLMMFPSSANAHQGRDSLRQRLAQSIHVGFGVHGRKADAQGAIRLVGGQAKGRKGGTDLGGMGRAGRAAGHANALCRQEIQHGLGLDVGKGKVQHMRRPSAGILPIGREIHAHAHLRELPFQAISQREHFLMVSRTGGKACLRRGAEAADAHDVLGARAQAALLTTAHEIGHDALGFDDVGMYVERPHALGAMDLTIWVALGVFCCRL